MQLIPILVTMTIITIAHGKLTTQISKPTPSSSIQNVNPRDRLIYKSPEERRKLAFFPKMNKRLVMTTPSFKMVTNKPFKYVPKKPLMRKFAILNKKKYIKDATEETITKNPLHKMKLKPHTELTKIEDPIKNDVIYKESLEINKNKFYDRDDLMQEDESEDQTSVAYLVDNDDNKAKAETIIISTQNPSEVEGSGDSFESIDQKEFIFLTPAKHPDIKNNVSTESLGEYATTLAPAKSRVKRSDNVIVEENMGTTVAGYKYTWSDRKLSNSLLFKNINS